MIQKPIYPENSYTISQYCKYWFRAEQSSGEMLNLVSGAASATKQAGFLDATLWANAGYGTVGGGAGGNYLNLVSSTHDVTLNGYTLIVSLRVKKSAATYPASEQYFIASYQPGVNNGGIIIACRTDGSARMYARATDATVVSVTTATNVLCDGSSASERSLVFCWPRESGQSATAAVDAIVSGSVSSSSIAGKSLAGGRTMQIGTPLGGGTLDAYQIAAFGAYLVPKDFSSLNTRQIYDWAYRNPGVPMPDWVFA